MLHAKNTLRSMQEIRRSNIHRIYQRTLRHLLQRSKCIGNLMPWQQMHLPSPVSANRRQSVQKRSSCRAPAITQSVIKFVPTTPKRILFVIAISMLSFLYYQIVITFFNTKVSPSITNSGTTTTLSGVRQKARHLPDDWLSGEPYGRSEQDKRSGSFFYYSSTCRGQ